MPNQERLMAVTVVVYANSLKSMKVIVWSTVRSHFAGRCMQAAAGQNGDLQKLI
jgi:hypothetical protein